MAFLPKKVPDPCNMRSLKLIWVAVIFVDRCFLAILGRRKKDLKNAVLNVEQNIIKLFNSILISIY